MEIIEIKEFVNNFRKLSESNNLTLVVWGAKLYVLNGKYPSCDFAYCLQNNLETVQTNHFGGTIVSFPEDINYVRFSPTNENYALGIMRAFCSYLKTTKGITTELSNNDILIDGFKVASGMSTNVSTAPQSPIFYTGVHFSVNIDLETIRGVCTKPMVKVPKALSDYGITKQNILDFLKEYQNGND